MAKHIFGVRVMVRVSIPRIFNLPKMMPENFQNLPEHRLKHTANVCEGIRVNIPTGSETRVRGVQKKRFLDVTSVRCIVRSPTPPTSMMAVGRGVLERAKKTFVYVLRRLLTSCAVIIEEGGVGGSRAQDTFSHERFFRTYRNQTLF